MIRLCEETVQTIDCLHLVGWTSLTNKDEYFKKLGPAEFKFLPHVTSINITNSCRYNLINAVNTETMIIKLEHLSPKAYVQRTWLTRKSTDLTIVYLDKHDYPQV